MNLVLAFNFIPPILNLPVHVSLGGAGLTHQGTIRANDALKTENTLGGYRASHSGPWECLRHSMIRRVLFISP